MIDFLMPSLGADMEDGILSEWRVKPGDTVKRGDIIAEVETQKGLIEIEVFEEGTIADLLIEPGKKIPVGTVMAHILKKGEVFDKETMKAASEKNPAPALKEEAKSKPSETQVTEKQERLRVSPLAKKLAMEKGIDLSAVEGSGEAGAITMRDIENAAKKKSGEEKNTPSEKLRQAIAAAMSKSKREIPHYYLETKINMKAAITWLTEKNKDLELQDRLLLPVMFIKAVAKALTEVPTLNGWWNGSLQQKKEIHVGFVVALKSGGIIVPTLHDADKKNMSELMAQLNDLIPRARELKLRSSELSDSSITITSMGDQAVEKVYGIIYPPQVALVGFGSIGEQAWVENGQLVIRPILCASLSGDHRATDGTTGSRFLLALKKYLEQPELL